MYRRHREREREREKPLRNPESRVEEAQALPLFRLSHFFKITISHLKEEMEVWVRVGESKVTGVVVDNAFPRIDHLKKAIKLDLKNKFLAVDKDDIVIRDPISQEEIPSTKLLNLTDATEPGSVDNPFIVDAPQGIVWK